MKMIKYEYCAPDPKHYAADLRLDSHGGVLQWVSGRGQDVLIVQTAFGVNPIEKMDIICAEMEGMDFHFNGFFPLKEYPPKTNLCPYPPLLLM